MSATIRLTPTTAAPGELVNIDGAGWNPKGVKFALTTTNASGIEVGQTSNMNRVQRDGTFHVGIFAPPMEGTAKITCYQGSTVVEVPLTVGTVVVPPPVASGVYGSALAMDGKDNRPVGRSDGSHVAFRWHSTGGTLVKFAVNQRFGPDQANVGMGYSHGTGGLIHVTLQGTANGLPNGVVLAQATFQPDSPRTDDEDRTFIAFDSPATIPAGDYCLVADNIHADPTNNWMSFNCGWVGQPDSPRQPVDPSDVMAVLDRTNSHGWQVHPDNTPVFDIVKADGSHEGQGYQSVITGYEVDFTGSTKVREHFTYTGTDRAFGNVYIRLQRISGAGRVTATIAGVTGSADVSTLPPVSFATLTGGRWVAIPLYVLLRTGQTYDLEFVVSSGLRLKVMPIRKVTQDSVTPVRWGARTFTDGRGEKSVSGGAWQDIYGDADLQFYLGD